MRKYLLLTYIVNLIAFTIAFQLLGLILGLALTAGIYFVGQNIANNTKGLIKYVESLPLIFGHTLGIFAVHALFANGFLTLMIGIIEVSVVVIFMGIGDLG